MDRLPDWLNLQRNDLPYGKMVKEIKAEWVNWHGA